ncbi:MAG: MBL fold metallo-hydrolase [Candidatus Dadabacteria bacterium]|nr:MAG: MBL fold metallo-hydrolase [Candidatus Dadabacteria bacterium]
MKRLAALAAAVAVLGHQGCYRPKLVAGADPPRRLAGLAGRTWPRVAGMRLHVFNTGTNRVSPLLVGTPAPWRPAPAFVIEHPNRGLVVFDCGLGAEIARLGERALNPVARFLIKTRSLPGWDLPEQMEKAGLSPDRVQVVILSHLHFDHVGGCDAFRSARFVVGRGEREHGRSRMNGFEPDHVDWIPQGAWQVIDFDGAKPYATFDRTVDLFGDGSIVLVAGGGHTVGGLGALVHLPGGPVLLAGDLVVHFDWLRSNDVQRIAVDPERAAAVRNRVRRLLELAPEVIVFPGHDLPRIPPGRSDIIVHEPRAFRPLFWPVD